MKVLFVSDIHLGDKKERRYKLFDQFIEHLLNNPPEVLVLLGDIFDLWVGKHEYFVEKHQVLLNKLDLLRHKACEIHYFEGNHDLYLNKYFGEKLGFQIHPNHLQIRWNNKSVRMEHGDLANPEDKGYLFLRAFLRNPLIKLILNHIPGSWVKALGEKASQASRKYTDQFDEDSVEVIRNYTRRLLENEDFDYLITGHTHQRDIFVVEKNGVKRTSINLGSWFSEEVQVLEFTEEDMKFKNIENYLSDSKA